MSKIVIELNKSAETWRTNLLVSLIDDAVGSEFVEEIKEIRIEE